MARVPDRADGPVFRPARAEDLPDILALLQDDPLGARRESGDLERYAKAFREIESDSANLLVVGAQDGEIVACYQLTVIPGLSLQGARRAQIESVRVATDRRGRGLGARLVADAEARARAAGCALLQLTTNRSRADAQWFYDRLGFTPSHIGYKKPL